MPRGDGKGPPWGSGPGTGGGAKGMGRMKGTRAGAGPSGECICPSCGAKVPHQRANPCYNVSCPQCGTNMVRA
jgi:hypothetical protein